MINLTIWGSYQKVEGSVENSVNVVDVGRTGKYPRSRIAEDDVIVE